MGNSVSATSQTFTREWTCHDDEQEWICITESCFEDSCDGPGPCTRQFLRTEGASGCGFEDIYPPDEDEDDCITPTDYVAGYKSRFTFVGTDAGTPHCSGLGCLGPPESEGSTVAMCPMMEAYQISLDHSLDKNKLQHYFGNPKHNLDKLLKKGMTKEQIVSEVLIEVYLDKRIKPGHVFENVPVTVQGETVFAKGYSEPNGVIKLSDIFIRGPDMSGTPPVITYPKK